MVDAFAKNSDRGSSAISDQDSPDFRSTRLSADRKQSPAFTQVGDQPFQDRHVAGSDRQDDLEGNRLAIRSRTVVAFSCIGRM